MSFYQKYRPKKIAELDLVSVRESLESTLKSGKVSHAYLFVGPRGSGKTSTARILAQLVNCAENQGKKKDLLEPCGKCEACVSVAKGSSVDVIEIDAASSGLVDDIRDLREKVRLAPVTLPKKVYIIDEVHMVSTAGFNALLKTLEEPPEHAIFILCTTEAQKVPETIASRCARVNFTKATIREVERSLMKAVKGEELDIDEDALKEIAEATDGSFREGHKLLEQVAAYGKKIDLPLVLRTLGVVGRQSVLKLLEAVEKEDSKLVVEMFADMEKVGIKANVLLLTLLAETRKRMEDKLTQGFETKVEMNLIDRLIVASEKIKISPLPLLPLEIALLAEMMNKGGGGSPRPKVETPAQSAPKEAEPEKLNDKLNTRVEWEKAEASSIKDVQEYDGPLASIDKIKIEWIEFLKGMSGSCGSLAGLLRLVSPVELQGKSLTLEVTSRFQQDMLERETKKKIIEEQMAKIWGPMTFKCVLGEKTPPREIPEAQDANIEPVASETHTEQGIMEAAEKIFGG